MTPLIQDRQGREMIVDLDDFGFILRDPEEIGHRLDQFLIVQHRGHLQRSRGDLKRKVESACLDFGLSRADAVVDSERFGVPLLNGHPALGIEIRHAKDAVTDGDAVPLDTGETGIIEGDPHILIGQDVAANGVFLAFESFFVDRKMIDVPLGVDRLHVHPDDAVFDRAGGKLVAGLLVEESDREFDRVAGFGLPDIRVDPQLDDASDLSRVVGTWKRCWRASGYKFPMAAVFAAA